jgi:GGDEF domain-containing protein
MTSARRCASVGDTLAAALRNFCSSLAVCSALIASTYASVDRSALEATHSSELGQTALQRKSSLLDLVNKLSSNDDYDVIFDLSMSLFDELTKKAQSDKRTTQLLQRLDQLAHANRDEVRIYSAKLRATWRSAPKTFSRQLDMSGLDAQYRAVLTKAYANGVTRHLSDMRFILRLSTSKDDIAARFRWLNRSRKVAATLLTPTAAAPWILELDWRLGLLLIELGQTSDAKAILESAKTVAESIDAPEMIFRIRWAQGKILLARNENGLAADLFNDLVEENRKSRVLLDEAADLFVEAVSANVSIDDCPAAKNLIESRELESSPEDSTAHSVSLLLLKSKCLARSSKLSLAKRELQNAQALMRSDTGNAIDKVLEVAEIELIIATQQPSLTDRKRAADAFMSAQLADVARKAPKLALVANEILEASGLEQQLVETERNRDLSSLTAEQLQFSRYINSALMLAVAMISVAVYYALRQNIKRARQSRRRALSEDPQSGALTRASVLLFVANMTSLSRTLRSLIGPPRYILILRLGELPAIEKALPATTLEDGLKDLVNRIARLIGGKKYVGRLQPDLFAITLPRASRADIMIIANRVNIELHRKPILQTASGACVIPQLYSAKLRYRGKDLLKNMEPIAQRGASTASGASEARHAA